jgi:DNA anti-recombination protein RmuC
MEKNGDYLSKSTLSRVFQDGSENLSFRYEETIRPIAKALLDIETIEEDDNLNVQTMKALLKYKIQRIEELEAQIEQMRASFDHERVKIHERNDREREQLNKQIEFLHDQILMKDQRFDTLLESTLSKDLRYEELLALIMEKKK